MKRLSAIVATALVLVLSLALVGCGEKDYSDKYAGNWKLSAMTDVSEEDLELMESLGMTALLNLNEDKTAELNFMGEAMEGTWEPKSDSECDITFEGETMTATLSGEELSLEAEGESMKFKKISAEDAAALAEAMAAAGEGLMSGLEVDGDDSGNNYEEVYDESFVPVVVANDDVVTIEVTGKKTDAFGDSGYLVTIFNNSDVPIFATILNGSSSIDGKMIGFWGGETVQPGKMVEDAFFYVTADDVASLDELVNTELTFEVWDDDTYDTLGEYPVTLN